MHNSCISTAENLVVLVVSNHVSEKLKLLELEVQMRATKTAAYYISPIEIGVL